MLGSRIDANRHSKWFHLAMGAALTIVNTGSISVGPVVLTELKTEMPTQVEGPNIIYRILRGPDGRTERGRSTG